MSKGLLFGVRVKANANRCVKIHIFVAQIAIVLFNIIYLLPLVTLTSLK